jgi:PKD repeat protein
LSYAWDLDNDGAFDDGAQPTAAFTYTSAGTYTARLRVTDQDGLTDTASVTITVSNSSPSAGISQPASTLTWQVGQVISFSGTATDPEEGTLAPTAMTWTLIMQHCPSNCHQHTIQQFDGVASGQFTAPDHEYPSHLELSLTVRDSTGASDTKLVALQPQTVDLTFETAPAGLQIVVGPSGSTATFTRRVIVGSNNSVSVQSPQALSGQDYNFIGWSDGGAQSHNITAPASPATYRATFEPVATPSQPPSAPTGLIATRRSGQITLTWTDSSNNETGFSIERSPDGQAFSQIATVAQNVSTYVDTSPGSSKFVFYRVRAFNLAGNSAYTNALKVRNR